LQKDEDREEWTNSERSFADLLEEKNIPYERIKEGENKRPDFKILWNPPCWVEVKEHYSDSRISFKRSYEKIRMEAERTPESNLRFTIKNKLQDINEKFNGLIGKKTLIVYSDRSLREKTPTKIIFESHIKDNKPHLGVPHINSWTPTKDCKEFENSFIDSVLDLILILDNTNNKILDIVFKKDILLGKDLDNYFKNFFNKLFNIDNFKSCNLSDNKISQFFYGKIE
jgi:hypothetical protein